MPRHRVLCVGLIALDIVSTCQRFPDEDEDIRAISQKWQAGGNACTNATVLTQLGCSVSSSVPCHAELKLNLSFITCVAMECVTVAVFDTSTVVLQLRV